MKQRPAFAHEPQAMQPDMGFTPSWKTSVAMPFS